MYGVYIGSRHDIRPLISLPKIKKWIFMDALPEYKAGFNEDKYSSIKKKDLYLKDCETEFMKLNFLLVQHNVKENMIIFKKKERQVTFFYNTHFPNCSPLQLKLLKNVNCIYLSAFDPHRDILKMVCKKTFTLFIASIPLFYRWYEKKNILNLDDKSLITYLLLNYVENIKYVKVDDTLLREPIRLNKLNKLNKINKINKLNKTSKINKLVKLTPVYNLLDYHYLELKDEKHSTTMKSLKGIRSII